MKFKIKYTGEVIRSEVKFLKNEFSFDTEPIVNEIDFDLSYNRLNLTVVNNTIVQVWGFAGGDKRIVQFNNTIPKHQKGALLVEGEFDYNLNYHINDAPVPVYQNEKTGWICIGDPNSEGEGVEFIRNCVAFVNEKGSLTSLWIKPIYV